MQRQRDIVSHFFLQGEVATIEPLGQGLINDTYKVSTTSTDTPDYVLQRINHHIFTDVDLLQRNIEAVTQHIRQKLLAAGVTNINRRVLQFAVTPQGKTYYYDGESYWRVSRFIEHTVTYNEVTPQHSYEAGVAFGEFEQMLTDLPETLGETIPRFHDMELRLQQLHEAVDGDAAGRVGTVQAELDQIWQHADAMCEAERLQRQGLLPLRVCHCDTKVNNMLFDALPAAEGGESGQVLCVIDLDTVMPATVFSDYGDFLRTAANTEAEDSPQLDRIAFRQDIFEAFTRGYLQSAGCFLTPIEVQHLPYAVARFPFMQAVRFLADYLNGDTYYKTAYADHNLVRTRNQLRFFHCVQEQTPKLEEFISSLNS